MRVCVCVCVRVRACVCKWEPHVNQHSIAHADGSLYSLHVVGFGYADLVEPHSLLTAQPALGLSLGVYDQRPAGHVLYDDGILRGHPVRRQTGVVPVPDLKVTQGSIFNGVPSETFERI